MWSANRAYGELAAVVLVIALVISVKLRGIGTYIHVSLVGRGNATLGLEFGSINSTRGVSVSTVWRVAGSEFVLFQVSFH